MLADNAWKGGLGGFIFIGGVILLYQVLYYHSFFFVIEEHKMVVESGIIFKKSYVVPFDQLQNVVISRGLISSLFGLSRIQIWLALPAQVILSRRSGRSGGKPDCRLDLLIDDAEMLMNLLYKKDDIKT